MSYKNKLLLLVVGLFVMSAGFSQETTLRILNGVVKDSKGTTLEGITVSEKGTTNAVITNSNGSFSIKVKLGKVTLLFTGVGYKAQEIAITGDGNLSVQMTDESKELSDVVVVGYGTQKKANLTGATSTVKMDQILGERPVSSTAQLLQGVTPGLQVTLGSGRPGDAANLNIRGATGLTSSGFAAGSPQILVDNTVFDGPLTMIDPNDIESITVLKDAGSAAIYGGRSAFGVILVTTKKGRKNQKTQFNYSNNVVFSSATNLPEKASAYYSVKSLLDGGAITGSQGEDYATWMKLIQEYDSMPSKYPLGYTNYNNKFYQLASTDAIGELLGHSATQLMNNFNINGGSDKTTYRLSFGSTKENGILLPSAGQDKYKRYNVKSVISSDVTNWLNTQLDVAYNNSATTWPGYTNAYLYATRHPSHLRTDTIPVAGYPGLIASAKNMINTTAPKTNKEDMLRVSAKAILKPFKDFTVTGEYTFSNYHQLFTNYDRLTYLRDPYGWALQPFGTGTFRKDNVKTNYSIVNIYGNYKKVLNQHTFSLMGGFNQEFRDMESNWVSRTSMINADVPSISTGSGTIDGSDNYSQFATRGVFGRFNYDYANKYLLEVNGRYDGSSRFPQNNRWGFFPSVSGGWRLGEESFMEWSKSFLNELKLRGSYGSVGNQAIGEYQFIATMSPYTPQWINNGSIVVTENAPGLISPDFTWETVTTRDLGLSFGALKNRLTGEFDYYIRDTKGILSRSDQPVPAVLGTSAPLTNAASLRSKGWEVELNWRDRIGKVNYYVSANLYDFSSTVTEVNNNQNKLLSSLYVGQKMGEIWGYQTARLYQVSDFVEGTLNANLTGGTLKPGIPRFGTQSPNVGDVMYMNLNGDTVVNAGKGTFDSSGDRRVIGNSSLRYQFGFRSGVSYKGFDLSVVVNGVGRQDQWRANPITFPNYQPQLSALYTNQLDYWTKENKDKKEAFYGRIYTDAPTSVAQGYNQQVQTRYLLNGAYIRLRNISLAYHLPRGWNQKLKLQNTTLSCSVEDPYVFHHMPKGMYPDISDLGNGLGYPFMRKISFGLNITF